MFFKKTNLQLARKPPDRSRKNTHLFGSWFILKKYCIGCASNKSGVNLFSLWVYFRTYTPHPQPCSIPCEPACAWSFFNNASCDHFAAISIYGHRTDPCAFHSMRIPLLMAETGLLPLQYGGSPIFYRSFIYLSYSQLIHPISSK